MKQKVSLTPSLQVSVAMATPSHPGSPGLPPLQALVLVCIPTPHDSLQAENPVQSLHEAQICINIDFEHFLRAFIMLGVFGL